MKSLVAFSVLVFFVFTIPLHAQVPRTLSYQGILTDTTGRPKPDGSYSFAFRLYPSANGGTALWTETKTLLVSRGLFSTVLGDLVAVNLSFDAQYWLSIQVAADPELSPRIPLTSVGYTIHALKADTARYAQSAGSGGTNYWTANGNNISNTNSGNVGVGTSSPAVKLDVNGSLNANSGATITGTNGDGAVITARHSGADPYVIIDASPVSQNSVLAYRKNNFNRWLMFADGVSESGNNAGSDFRLDAYNDAGAGIANRLYVNRATGNVGIGTTSPSAKLSVETAIPGVDAVSGYNTSASTGYGVFGGAFNFGVVGRAIANSGVNYGVFGFTYSQASGYGVYSSGNIGASGTKSFRIDHPKDPTGKYLLHYSAEGPEPQNVYNGNVVTDGSGYASITLPDYFEEINKDPRYTLTVINEGGADFVQAMVVQKIRNNQFAIRTSKPAIEVSWEVKALRNDLWVRTYGAPVQVEKQGPERGKYQHPELYGMPKEMGMNYRPEMEHVGTPPPEKEKQ